MMSSVQPSCERNAKVCFVTRGLCLCLSCRESTTVDPVFLFKSHSWPNQIWSGGDGWLHFRETTPLRDPGTARITNGFLIIFHHPILCLSLISPVIPKRTSRELHLNLCDQSRPGSSLSHTCVTAPNTLCVHKVRVLCDRPRAPASTYPRVQEGVHLYIFRGKYYFYTLSLCLVSWCSIRLNRGRLVLPFDWLILILNIWAFSSFTYST